MSSPVQSFYTWYKTTLENPKYRWLMVGATLLYLLSPIDVLPDFIPILGLVDDAVVASMFVGALSQIVLSGLTNKKQSGLRADAPDAANTTVDVDFN
ncbi:YkvA family protein [Nodosilinea sp. E11]|uniref:YkvA family protein n=1 Tax=Nodosilinea sp. E11 TaxID=3037479 RepID=UPI0029343401|nr:YkvA family protein [Nodosilinea sp. E11]WOD38176.1 YkvA family protein [Nodosilinea sp. E11]